MLGGYRRSLSKKASLSDRKFHLSLKDSGSCRVWKWGWKTPAFIGLLENSIKPQLPSGLILKGSAAQQGNLPGQRSLGTWEMGRRRAAVYFAQPLLKMLLLQFCCGYLSSIRKFEILQTGYYPDVFTYFMVARIFP